MPGTIKLLDSLNFFIECQDNSSSILTVTASGTGTYTGSDVTNTVHKGGTFFVNFTTINATCTAIFLVQGKDPVSGAYGPLARVSMDALATASVGCKTIQLYPGVVTTVGSAGEFHHDSIFTRIIRIVASITATASAGGAATSFTVGISKSV